MLLERGEFEFVLDTSDNLTRCNTPFDQSFVMLSIGDYNLVENYDV